MKRIFAAGIILSILMSFVLCAQADTTTWQVASVHPIGYTYMYSEPSSTTGKLLSKYVDGTIITSFDDFVRGTSDTGSLWCYVMGPDNMIGYIRKNNLCRWDTELTGKTYKVQSKHPVGYTYLYSEPTSSGVCLGSYKDGVYVTVRDEVRGTGDTGSTWCFVIGPDGRQGYIRKDNLVVPMTPSEGKSYVVASEHPVGYTYMYSKPTSSGQLMGTYYDGAIVTVYSTAQGMGNTSSTWYYCRGTDGVYGYIRSNNLKPAN